MLSTNHRMPKRPFPLAAFVAAFAVRRPCSPAHARNLPQRELRRHRLHRLQLRLRQTDDVRMFWGNGEGEPYHRSPRWRRLWCGQGLTLNFAINGGMYGDDFCPIGLYVENGQEAHRRQHQDVTGTRPIFTRSRTASFIWRGQGGCGDDRRVCRSRRPTREFATQSGPMLVIDGKIHPASSKARLTQEPRRGRRQQPDGGALRHHGGRVSFDHFARFFRDGLGCENALFLDGTHLRHLCAGTRPRRCLVGYGPIIGVVN